MGESALRVLIVDDEAPARRRLRELLDDCTGVLALSGFVTPFARPQGVPPTRSSAGASPSRPVRLVPGGGALYVKPHDVRTGAGGAMNHATRVYDSVFELLPSEENSPAPWPVNGVHVVTPLMALWWPLPGPLAVAAWLSRPLST